MPIRELRVARFSEGELGERPRSDPLEWKIEGEANRNYSIPRMDRPAAVPRSASNVCQKVNRSSFKSRDLFMEDGG